MNQFNAWSEALQETSPSSVIALAVFVVAMLAVARSFPTASAPAKSQSARLILPSFGLLVVFMVFASQGVRARIRSSASLGDGLVSVYAAVDARIMLLHAWLVLLWSALVLVRAARTLGRPSAESSEPELEAHREWLLGAFGSMLALCSGLVVYAKSLEAGLYPWRGFLQTDLAQIARAVSLMPARYQNYRLAAVALGLAILAVGLRRIHRRRGAATERTSGLPAALSVAAIGCMAFAMTRSMASDARRPLALLKRRDFAYSCYCDPRSEKCSADSAARFPVVDRCRETADGSSGPRLVFQVDGSLTVNGAVIGRADALEADKLRAELGKSLRDSAQLHPGRAPLGTLVLRAAAKVPTTQLATPLAIAAELGLTTTLLCAAPQGATQSTQTLGKLPRHEGCAALLHVRGAGQPFARFATWNDVARAASARGGEIDIALP